jgi:hypothetical protein
MAAFLEQVAASDSKLLWLDDTDYSAALLAGGAPPWLDATAYVAWRRKAQSLLKSNVIAVPVARIFSSWLANDASLRAASGAKTRANFPLRTMLAAADLRRHLAEIIAGLRSSFPMLAVALVCPSPRAWVGDAYHWAFGDAAEIEVGEDEVDAATLHSADFLREFGGSGIDTVLLEESARSEPATTAEIEWYRSVLNVGTHYRWDMGLRLPGERFGGDDLGGFSYVVGPKPFGAPCFGRVVADEFWRGADADISSPSDFSFSRIPSDIEPEVVLDRLALLR